MPRKSKTRAPKKQDVKRSRADLKRLRDLGFISKHVDLRKKPSAAQLKTIKKYSDLLQGRAVIVPVPKGKSKQYRGFRPYKGQMVIPKEKGEKIRVDKKTGMPYRQRKGSKTYIPGRGGKLPPVPKGKKRRYHLTFKNVRKFHKRIPKASDPASGTITFDSLGGSGGMAAFMASYEDDDDANGFNDWMDYVEVEDYGDYDDYEGAEE